jgi:hypothetical protein
MTSKPGPYFEVNHDFGAGNGHFPKVPELYFGAGRRSCAMISIQSADLSSLFLSTENRTQ